MSNNVTDKWGILYCPKGGLLSNPKRRWERIEAALHEQNIEFDNMAPDTAEEILHGMELLRGWMKASAVISCRPIIPRLSQQTPRR